MWRRGSSARPGGVEFVEEGRRMAVNGTVDIQTATLTIRPGGRFDFTTIHEFRAAYESRLPDADRLRVRKATGSRTVSITGLKVGLRRVLAVANFKELFELHASMTRSPTRAPRADYRETRLGHTTKAPSVVSPDVTNRAKKT